MKTSYKNLLDNVITTLIVVVILIYLDHISDINNIDVDYDTMKVVIGGAMMIALAIQSIPYITSALIKLVSRIRSKS